LEKHGISFIFEINLPQVPNLREVLVFVILYILIMYSKVSKYFDFFEKIFFQHLSEGLEPSEVIPTNIRLIYWILFHKF